MTSLVWRSEDRDTGVAAGNDYTQTGRQTYRRIRTGVARRAQRSPIEPGGWILQGLVAHLANESEADSWGQSATGDGRLGGGWWVGG